MSSSSTTSSIQGEPLVGGSDDTGPSLFTRLAVPPAVVPPKSPSLEMPSLNFVASNLLVDIEPWMSLQLFRTTTRPSILRPMPVHQLWRDICTLTYYISRRSVPERYGPPCRYMICSGRPKVPYFIGVSHVTVKPVVLILPWMPEAAESV